MYIEMVDETGQVSDEILKQTQEILEFAAQKIGKEDKEMAVTFVTNERSHELNLEYRDTDRPTDVISLEYKPEMEISFDEEDLAENPELAEMMGYDVYWLSREIKKRTGKTYKELLLSKRMQQASYLLTKSSLPVTDIIELVGYDNSSYFYRKFKEKYGLSPKEYRKGQ